MAHCFVHSMNKPGLGKPGLPRRYSLMGYSKKLIMYWGFTSIIITDAFFPHNDAIQQSSQFQGPDFVHFNNSFTSVSVRFHDSITFDRLFVKYRTFAARSRQACTGASDCAGTSDSFDALASAGVNSAANSSPVIFSFSISSAAER